MFTGIRDYIKYIKRCFSRLTHRTTIYIRQGKITRDEFLEIIKKYEGVKPKSLSYFLDILGLTEQEFNEICLMHLIRPAESIDPNNLPEGPKLWDQDIWFRDKESEGVER